MWIKDIIKKEYWGLTQKEIIEKFTRNIIQILEYKKKYL